MHKTLERQLKKFIDLNAPFPPGWDAFLQAIDETYTHTDEDRLLIERSLELSSQELTEKNHNLRASLASAKELEERLRVEKESVEKIVEERTKQLNEEAARLQSSIHSLNIGLIMTDSNKKLLIMNTAAKSMLLSNPDIQTHPLSESVFSSNVTTVEISHLQHFFSNDVDLTAEVDRCMREKQVTTIGEITHGRKLLYLSLRPILAIERNANNEREILGVIMIIQDITEQRALERSKDEFFSIASHELRTPLTAIRGNTSLIKQYYLDKLTPELKEMVEDIHESSVRLIAIVNDFLDTSRLDMGKMQFKKEPFAVVPLV